MRARCEYIRRWFRRPPPAARRSQACSARREYDLTRVYSRSCFRKFFYNVQTTFLQLKLHRFFSKIFFHSQKFSTLQRARAEVLIVLHREDSTHNVLQNFRLAIMCCRSRQKNTVIREYILQLRIKTWTNNCDKCSFVLRTTISPARRSELKLKSLFVCEYEEFYCRQSKGKKSYAAYEKRIIENK